LECEQYQKFVEHNTKETAVRRFLYWLSSFLRVRFIRGGANNDAGDYLERYFLFNAFGVTAYLHRFIGSDPDPGVHHNHPFAWAYTLVLAGWYEEERYTGLIVEEVADEDDAWRVSKTRVTPRVVSNIRRPFNLCSIDQHALHRVNLVPGGECWTLFVHGPWCKPWGFVTHDMPKDRYEFEEYPGSRNRGAKGDQWWLHAMRGKDHRLP
jgi:hypothetical protein